MPRYATLAKSGVPPGRAVTRLTKASGRTVVSARVGTAPANDGAPFTIRIANLPAGTAGGAASWTIKALSGGVAAKPYNMKV